MKRENPYLDLCLQVQAARRWVDGLRSPLAPALGIAAHPYPHQLANVHRVLTDLRVRHLLADEVGLGKTVQALMVINALRWQRRERRMPHTQPPHQHDLRDGEAAYHPLHVLVIVPDELRAQWSDELVTRAHIAAGRGEALTDEEASYEQIEEATVHLVSPSSFEPSMLDTRRFEMLVVDELHSLSADIQNRIVSASSRFAHALFLTATPSFQQVTRHAQLFELLEPERVQRVKLLYALDAEGSDDHAEPERSTPGEAQLVVSALLRRDREHEREAATEALASAALCHCAYRRVIRTRRAMYEGVLPQRRHVPVVVEALDAEQEREALLWEYFEALRESGSGVDSALLARRAALSPASIEGRVRDLRTRGFEHDGLLERIQPLTSSRHGDARLDALVDLLIELWEANPDERVLIAAQDNPTVDYLFKSLSARLPLIGPLTDRRALKIAHIRQLQGRDDAAGEGDYGSNTHRQLDDFQRGEAQLLIVPELAQRGLNLQCARVLVLYSVPWHPGEVEQWIGRLDRIGNTAINSYTRTIDVYTIARRGLIDEKVILVLGCFDVFARGVNLDGDHIEQVAALIETAALGTDEARWRELEVELTEMAARDRVKELDSPLRPHLPWSPHQAHRLLDTVTALPPAQPALVNVWSGPTGWDRALEGMLDLLDRAREYNVRFNRNGDLKFQSLWYRFDRDKKLSSKVCFSVGADPKRSRKPMHAFTFITRRNRIASPPLRTVSLTFDGVQYERPLRFFNFGDTLHDELIEGWYPHADGVSVFEVTLSRDHVFWETGAQDIYLVRLTTLDPAWALERDGQSMDRLCDLMRAMLAHKSAEEFVVMMQERVAQARCMLDADIRWLRDQLNASSTLDVRRMHHGGWPRLDEQSAAALLNPLAHDRDVPLDARARELFEDERKHVRDGYERMTRTDAGQASQVWGHLRRAFERALALRLEIIEVEASDALALEAVRVEQAMRNLELAQERGTPGVITRRKNELSAREDERALTALIWQQRRVWLEGVWASLMSLKPAQVVLSVVRANRMN